MDKELLLARSEDTLFSAQKNNAPCFLGFLTEDEAAAVKKHLEGKGLFCFFGGFDEAQRKYLACLPPWCDQPQYPIVALSFSFNSNFSLSHRDFLGALMSLGITRESIGDILVEKGRAVVFLNREIAPFVKTQLLKVGAVGVNITEGFKEPLPCFGEKAEFSCTVASLRLDCVIGALCSISRREATQLIEDKRVSVGGFLAEKPTKLLASGDRVAVKGKGVFTLTEAGSLSKKGRIILKYEKYV